MAGGSNAGDTARRPGAAGRRDAGRARSRSSLSRAHFLRLGVAALLAAVYAPHPARADEYHPLDTRRIIELTNQSRRKEGLPPLAVDERLMAAARAKLFDMLKRDYF